MNDTKLAKTEQELAKTEEDKVLKAFKDSTTIFIEETQNGVPFYQTMAAISRLESWHKIAIDTTAEGLVLRKIDNKPPAATKTTE